MLSVVVIVTRRPGPVLRNASSTASPTASSTRAVALALVLIYKATGIVNFAQGEMAMFGTFIAWV